MYSGEVLTVQLVVVRSGLCKPETVLCDLQLAKEFTPKELTIFIESQLTQYRMCGSSLVDLKEVEVVWMASPRSVGYILKFLSMKILILLIILEFKWYSECNIPVIPTSIHV